MGRVSSIINNNNNGEKTSLRNNFSNNTLKQIFSFPYQNIAQKTPFSPSISNYSQFFTQTHRNSSQSLYNTPKTFSYKINSQIVINKRKFASKNEDEDNVKNDSKKRKKGEGQAGLIICSAKNITKVLPDRRKLLDNVSVSFFYGFLFLFNFIIILFIIL